VVRAFAVISVTCAFVSNAEEMLHEVQMYSQITPMEIDILFQLADCRHPDGFVTHVYRCAGTAVCFATVCVL